LENVRKEKTKKRQAHVKTSGAHKTIQDDKAREGKGQMARDQQASLGGEEEMGDKDVLYDGLLKTKRSK